MGRLDEVARTLYALPPAEFTAGRNAAAKDEPDPEAARRRSAASASRRRPRAPSTLSCAPNRMRSTNCSRSATGLRAAQEGLDRDAVRDFATATPAGDRRPPRRRLASVVAGLSASTLREVEETLQAAMIDRAAAAALQSGFLVRGLESSGLEPVDVSEAVALPIDVEQLEAQTRPPHPGPARSAANSREPASDDPPRNHANPPPSARRGNAATRPPSSAPSARSPNSPRSPSRCRGGRKPGRPRNRARSPVA